MCMSNKQLIIIFAIIVVVSIVIGILIGLRSPRHDGEPEDVQPSRTSLNTTPTLPSKEYVQGRNEAMRSFQERVYQSSKEKR